MMISILMANYNKATFIEAAVNSVLSQTYRDWELLVIDDGSQDGSQEYIAGLAAKDGRIRVFRHEQRQGFARSLIDLIKEARGEILAIVDSDDALDKSALTKVMAVYEQNPEVGYVYTQCWYCYEGLKPAYLGYSRQLGAGESNLDANAVVALRSFRRSAYDLTAGFDPDLEPAEDYDLTLKLEEKTKLYFVDEPLYYYRILKSSQTRGFSNEMKNKAKTALARWKAYQRRNHQPALLVSKAKMSRTLFAGQLSALLAGEFKDLGYLGVALLRFNPFFFLQGDFYKELF